MVKTQKLRKQILGCIVALTLVSQSTISYAQTSIPARPQPVGIVALFEQSRTLLQQADAVCDVDSCHEAVKQAAIELQNGIGAHQVGDWAGEEKKAWHKRFGARLIGIRAEMESVQERGVKGQQVLYLEEFGTRAHLQRAAYTCDQVGYIGAGLTALYLAVSAAAGVILGIAVLYGYNQCIQANG